MARQAYRRDINGAPRRAAKRTRIKNSRWMHLGAAAVGTRQLLQRCWARRTAAAMDSLLLASYAIVLRQIFNQPALVSQAFQAAVFVHTYSNGGLQIAFSTITQRNGRQ